jgi:hypothetical protein
MLGVKEEAVDFVAGYLRSDPDMPMRELQELGAIKGINVYPLIMGLAKKKLGMGRPKRISVRKSSAARRVSREPSASVSNSKDPSSLVNNFVAHMKRLEQENQTLRATLQRIAEMVRR